MPCGILKKKKFLSLVPNTEIQKLREFLKWWLSLLYQEWDPLDSFGMRTSSQKPNQVTSIRNFSPTPWPQKGGAGDWVQLIMANDWLNFKYMIYILIKLLNNEVSGASRVVMEAPLYLALCVSSIWLFLSCILYKNKTKQKNNYNHNSLSWVLWVILAN